jgi:hypothetical protein
MMSAASATSRASRFSATGQRKVRVRPDQPAHDFACDGDSAEHVAFGGPILYAHEGESLHEKPTHPSNVFWHQAVEANKLYHALDRKHRELALVIKGMPTEELVGFKGKRDIFKAVRSPSLPPIRSGVATRPRHPARAVPKSDRDEVVKCLDAQGGSINVISRSTRKATSAMTACSTTGGSKARPSSGISAAARTSTSG